MDLRDKIIRRGVKALKEYGYPAVTKDNIMTDEIYRAFFKASIEDAKDVPEVTAILAEIEQLEVK